MTPSLHRSSDHLQIKPAPLPWLRKKGKTGATQRWPNNTSFTLVAVETTGVLGPDTLQFLRELGRRAFKETGDRKETEYIFQRISLAVVRGNATSLLTSAGYDHQQNTSPAPAAPLQSTPESSAGLNTITQQDLRLVLPTDNTSHEQHQTLPQLQPQSPPLPSPLERPHPSPPALQEPPSPSLPTPLKQPPTSPPVPQEQLSLTPLEHLTSSPTPQEQPSPAGATGLKTLEILAI